MGGVQRQLSTAEGEFAVVPSLAALGFVRGVQGRVLGLVLGGGAWVMLVLVLVVLGLGATLLLALLLLLLLSLIWIRTIAAAAAGIGAAVDIVSAIVATAIPMRLLFWLLPLRALWLPPLMRLPSIVIRRRSLPAIIIVDVVVAAAIAIIAIATGLPPMPITVIFSTRGRKGGGGSSCSSGGGRDGRLVAVPLQRPPSSSCFCFRLCSFSCCFCLTSSYCH